MLEIMVMSSTFGFVDILKIVGILAFAALSGWIIYKMMKSVDDDDENEDNKKDEEKIYILNVIAIALSQGEIGLETNNYIDELASKIDKDILLDVSLEEEIKKTSNILAEQLLVAKFVQGLPIVGIIGGAVNNKIISRVGRYSKIKYKKRYLLSKN